MSLLSPPPPPDPNGPPPVPESNLPGLPFSASEVMKWVGVLGLFLMAAQAAYKGDWLQAQSYATAGVAAAGFARSLAKTRAVAAYAAVLNRQVAADVQNIRENPVMPGTMLSAAEQLARSAKDPTQPSRS